jgi:hypothetical protein
MLSSSQKVFFFFSLGAGHIDGHFTK